LLIIIHYLINICCNRAITHHNIIHCIYVLDPCTLVLKSVCNMLNFWAICHYFIVTCREHFMLCVLSVICWRGTRNRKGVRERRLWFSSPEMCKLTIWITSIAECNATKMLFSPRTEFTCPHNCGRTYGHQHHLFAHNDFGCPKQYWKLRVCKVCWKSCKPTSTLRAHMLLAHNVITDWNPPEKKTTVHKRVW